MIRVDFTAITMKEFVRNDVFRFFFAVNSRKQKQILIEAGLLTYSRD
jgi:hypothetical protein